MLLSAKQLACLPADMSAVPLICRLGGTLIITDNYNDHLQIIMEQQTKFLSAVAPLNPDGIIPQFKCEANLQPLHPAVCL